MAKWIKPYTGGYDRDSAPINTVFDTEEIPLPTLSNDNSSNDLGQYADMWVGPSLGSDNEHAGNYSLPMPENNSIWENMKNGFMSGLNKADEAIIDIPKTIYKPFSWLADKVVPGYDPNQDYILQGLNNATDYYKNNGTEYDENIGDSTGSKVAATIAGFVPQAVEMGISLGIPLPKVGSVGKVLDNFGAPIEKSVSGLLNNSKLGEYAGKTSKSASEFAVLNALGTAAQGGDFSDIGKSSLEGAGMGALFGAGGKALGDLTHAIKGVGKVKILNDNGDRVTFQDENGNVQNMNKVIFDNTVQSLDTMNPIYADTSLDNMFKPTEMKSNNSSTENSKVPMNEILSMTKNDLFNAIDKMNPYNTYKPTETLVDWSTGKDKGQGKRVGNMVLGSMGDAPQGKKTYINIIGNIPEYKTNPDDFRGTSNIDKLNYLKAREYGLNHNQALLYSDMKHDSGGLSNEQIMDRFKHYGDLEQNNIKTLTDQTPFKVDNSVESPNLNINLQAHSNPLDIDINTLSRRGDANDLNLFEQRTGRAPKQVDYKERQTIANSFMNSEAIPQEVKDSLVADPSKYQYLEHNNEQAMSKARDLVEKNFDSSVAKIKNLKALEDDSDTALAIEIERKYIENGEYDKARDWSLKVAKLGTKSGQAIQYFSTIKKLTPEWTLNRASKMIDSSLTDKQKEILNNAPEGMADEIAKKNKIPHLSEDTTRKIVEMSKQIQDMPEGRAKREAVANLNDVIQSEIPSSILDKINSIQTLSMLSGTKTPIRNIIGNTFFKAIDNLKEIPRTMIDMPLSLITKERTATLPMLGDQLKGYGSGMKEAFLDLKNNVNTKNIDDKFELGRRVTWNKNGNLINKAMNQAERVNRFMLDDRPAMSSAYEGEMARQRKLAKINNVEFDEAAAKEKSTLKALHDTFNDDTAISDMVINLKRNANIVSNSVITGNGIGRKLDQATKDEFAKWGAGDLLVKFAKVPANIIARQVEYSPMSLVTPFVSAIRGAIKKEKFDQDAFADTLAKGMTGTGIMGLGAMLHNVMTTDQDKNKNKAELDKEAGLGQFKMNLSALQRMLSGGDTKTQKGDTIASYDWANPISVLLAAGASMAKATDGKTVKGVGKIAGDLVDALNEGVNSIIEQPMNQGLKTWVQQGDMMKGLSQAIAALPQTFIPSLVNQFRQLSDNTTRETYDPNIFKQSVNQMINRIPGLEQQLPQKVDIWGQPKETFQNGTNSLLNVFLNPAISTQYLPTPETQKSLDLYDKSSNSEALPKLADKTLTVDNQKVKLTPDQFIQLQSFMGQGATNIYDNILNDNNSNKLAKDTAKALSDVSQDSKIKVLQDNNLPLPISVDKSNLSQDLYKKRSTESKSVRDKIKDIENSDMTTDEQKKALQDLREEAQSAASKNSPKPRKKKNSTIFDK